MNISMKIPSKNLEDLKYPHQQVSPFDRCMMNLVLDDLTTYVSNEIPKGYILDSHRFSPSFMFLYDDVLSSYFQCFYDASIHPIILLSES